ncbi:DoxX family protein [Streptomyces sp. NPDC058045]|uniref:DoxX family protein n=1 Tax=Streptomyces sp. NPDC058045 TaxID=3346311 RepID=UPI0036ECA5A4
MFGRLNSAQPYAVGLFRMVTGLLFACHGVASLFGILGRPEAATGSWPGWYAAVIQLVGGGLVFIGLGTRGAAFISSGSMAYAYFNVHQSGGLWPMENGGEPAAMYCWMLLLLVFTGSGALGLDRFIAARGRSEAAVAEEPSPAAT